jgi:hypothetical protein
MQKLLQPHSIGSAIYCLNRMNDISPVGFDKARLLLLSQCHPECPDDFVPLEHADWTIIGEAIAMLQNEMNARTVDAKALVQHLKVSGHYESFFGKDTSARLMVSD